jgi:hypothetical protein
MKKAIFLAIAFPAVAVFGASQAHAQAACPQQNVFYPNGYYQSYCVPSYYPGFPQYLVYQNPTGGFSTNVQYNPFQPAAPQFTPPQGAFNGPTYYYPQQPFPGPAFGNGYWYGSGYNPNPGYGAGFNNGFNNYGVPYGNDFWMNGHPVH